MWTRIDNVQKNIVLYIEAEEELARRIYHDLYAENDPLFPIYDSYYQTGELRELTAPDRGCEYVIARGEPGRWAEKPRYTTVYRTLEAYIQQPDPGVTFLFEEDVICRILKEEQMDPDYEDYLIAQSAEQWLQQVFIDIALRTKDRDLFNLINEQKKDG